MFRLPAAVPGTEVGVDRVLRLGDVGVEVVELPFELSLRRRHSLLGPAELGEHAPSVFLLIAEPPGAVDGLGHIRDVTTTPEPDLVAKDPESARPASADGSLGDDATLVPAPVVDRCLLDYERSLRHFDLKRGVIELARRPPLQARG